jgi:hypothetical protein
MALVAVIGLLLLALALGRIDEQVFVQFRRGLVFLLVADTATRPIPRRGLYR